MENPKLSKEIHSSDEVSKIEPNSLNNSEAAPIGKMDPNKLDKLETSTDIKADTPLVQKKVKAPKLEDKPFEEFITKHLIPGLKSSIEQKGTLVRDIKLIEGNRPVVGGKCWMVFCEMYEYRKFWLCFNNDVITSDKTILLAESNSEPSIVESFLIDEKKTTLPLLISRVLQRLNGQKWIGEN